MNHLDAPMNFWAGPALSVLREAFPRRAASHLERDVARELPDLPTTGRAGFAMSLLAGGRRHTA